MRPRSARGAIAGDCRRRATSRIPQSWSCYLTISVGCTQGLRFREFRPRGFTYPKVGLDKIRLLCKNVYSEWLFMQCSVVSAHVAQVHAFFFLCVWVRPDPLQPGPEGLRFMDFGFMGLGCNMRNKGF